MDVTVSTEPWEEAVIALQRLAATLRQTVEEADKAIGQVRNARMTDALEMGGPMLAEHYPEAVRADGRLDLIIDGSGRPKPQDNPYVFWELTGDAALAARLVGTLQVAMKLLAQLREAQPELSNVRS